MINFNATKEEMELIDKIVARAGEATKGYKIDRISLEMDITATHLNGCPLKLVDLLEAPEFDFCHDIAGIGNHLDRTSGKLTDCFVPRYAV